VAKPLCARERRCIPHAPPDRARAARPEQALRSPAVEALDLTIYGGEFDALVGPNGAGKTTTLRMGGGLLHPDSGSICINGIDAAGVSQGIVRQRRWSAGFRHRSPARVLRQKEWTLLARDPWLVSQTLMQILYLLPAALLL
jgi:ABC-type uncharacterized transport system ATPase subunit